MNAIEQYESLLASNAPAPKLKSLLEDITTETIHHDRMAKEFSDLADRGKTILKQVAIAELTPEVGPFLEGSSYTFIGIAGDTATVEFPNKSLIRGCFIGRGGKFMRYSGEQLITMPNLKVLSESEKNFGVLFATSYKPAKGFRELAPKLLRPSGAAQILEACEEPTAPRVRFGTKTPATSEALPLTTGH